MGVQSDHKRPVHGLVMELVQNVDIDSKPDLVLYRCPRNDSYYSPGTEKYLTLQELRKDGYVRAEGSEGCEEHLWPKTARVTQAGERATTSTT